MHLSLEQQIVCRRDLELLELCIKDTEHTDDKDSTQKELQEEQETLLEEIAALKTPLTEVQEDLKKLRDIRYWVRKLSLIHICSCIVVAPFIEAVPPF